LGLLLVVASRVTNTSVISRGYGEKSELQDLNKVFPLPRAPLL